MTPPIRLDKNPSDDWQESVDSKSGNATPHRPPAVHSLLFLLSGLPAGELATDPEVFFWHGCRGSYVETHPNGPANYLKSLSLDCKPSRLSCTFKALPLRLDSVPSISLARVIYPPSSQISNGRQAPCCSGLRNDRSLFKR